ncbi:MAG: site-2 protease family protein [Thermoflexales bacterium]|nr:site-2 protease family protein [Thermoflexales bacterium]MDW8352132.1 site-2 protease family protein [Anaerolineae bacterium]
MWPDRLELVARLRAAVEDVMRVEAYTVQPNGEISLRGQLMSPPDEAYRRMRPRLEDLGYTPYLRASGERHELLAMPGVIRRAPSNPAINLVLFVATLLSVIFTGGLTATGFDLGNGLMFGASLLGILGVHEAGHYLVGRLRGAPVSLPYFIPLPAPFSFVGTLGAVIVQREPFENRRTLLEIAVAGPLAGFVLAVPLFVLGIWLSRVEPLPPAGEYVTLGDSLFTRLVALARFGRVYPSDGYDIMLHPIAFGAWIGLLITAINLIPAGQLDGGHIAYALLGARARYLSYAVIAAMLGLALISTSWLIWAVLLFLFARHHPPPLNEAVQLRPHHYALMMAAALVFILTFVPRPVY